MDPQALHTHIEHLKRDVEHLSDRVADLTQRRARLERGSHDYLSLIGELDRTHADLDDAYADLRMARRLRRALADELGFDAVYRHALPPHAPDHEAEPPIHH